MTLEGLIDLNPGFLMDVMSAYLLRSLLHDSAFDNWSPGAYSASVMVDMNYDGSPSP